MRWEIPRNTAANPDALILGGFFGFKLLPDGAEKFFHFLRLAGMPADSGRNRKLQAKENQEETKMDDHPPRRRPESDPLGRERNAGQRRDQCAHVSFLRENEEKSRAEEVRRALSISEHPEQFEERIVELAQAAGEKIDLTRRKFLTATTGAAAALLAMPRISSLKAEAAIGAEARSLLQENQSDLPEVAFKPKPDNFAWTFGGYKPLISAKPGQLVRLWTEDAFAGGIRSKQDLPTKVLKFPFVNPQTGPIYVEGAAVGDTLAIHFVDLQPAREWAASCTIPLFGSLTGTGYTQLLNPALPEIVWMYKVNRERKTVLYQANDSDWNVEIPLKPFHGTVGVAPKAMEVRNVLVPEAFGGNMDSPEARAGTTIFLGVNVEGALFSIGDGHYSQSEGEVCGVAVEGAMNTTLTVDVIKNTFVEWPRLEDDEYIMTAGSYRPLEDCFRIAYTQLVRWVSSDFGLSLMDAYQLVSQVSKTHVANVVDPNYTIIAKFPKRYLPPGREAMGGVHNKLRRLAKRWGDKARARTISA
jgi:acetamidase/formamidase